MQEARRLGFTLAIISSFGLLFQISNESTSQPYIPSLRRHTSVYIVRSTTYKSTLAATEVYGTVNLW